MRRLHFFAWLILCDRGSMGAAAAPTPLATHPQPRFSWATVPLFFHSTNASGLWSAAALARMAAFPLITFD